MAKYQPELFSTDEILYSEDDLRKMYFDECGDEVETFDEYVDALYVMVTPDGLYQESPSLRRTRDWLWGEVFPNLTIYR